jgi:hypothetical protein
MGMRARHCHVVTSTVTSSLECYSVVFKILKIFVLSLSVYGSTDLVGLGRFFSFLILYTVGRTPWTGDQPVERPLPTHRHPCFE